MKELRFEDFKDRMRVKVRLKDAFAHHPVYDKLYRHKETFEGELRHPPQHPMWFLCTHVLDGAWLPGSRMPWKHSWAIESQDQLEIEFALCPAALKGANT